MKKNTCIRLKESYFCFNGSPILELLLCSPTKFIYIYFLKNETKEIKRKDSAEW